MAHSTRAAARSHLPQARCPGATYRLQFNAGFGFVAAAGVVPYLAALGVTDLYASPYLKARFGSAHGYDVADPNALNPELGSEEDYEQLCACLAQHGMGQVLDVVPNHMGIGGSDNQWWLDVLENGPSSIHRRLFDIDWTPRRPDADDREKVVLPVLGGPYGEVLENGELVLCYQEGAFSLRYYDMTLPISPTSYPRLLGHRLDQIIAVLGEDHDQVLELQSIMTALRNLPSSSIRDEDKARERHREKEVVKRRLARLWEECPPLREALRATLEEFNGRKGEPESFDLLDSLLDEQNYRLAYWRVAAEEINYRRFFDVNELAAIRVEDPIVFEQTHRLLLELIASEKVTGLRVDHPDGLWDPVGYLWRLQRCCFIKLSIRGRRLPENSGDGTAGEVGGDEEALGRLYDALRARAPSSSALRPRYIVVEKILSPGETLDESWPVHGTTGYDFLNAVNGLFVDRRNRHAFSTIYARFTGQMLRYADVANTTRKMVMLISLASEVNQLAWQLKRLAARNRRYRDFTLNGLAFALREIIASLPVYRTYIDPGEGRVSERDRRAIETAVADAKRRNPRTNPAIFDFVRDTLLLETVPSTCDDGERERFVRRFQQTTGPVMAKGVEDTAFYVYNRLISLNEVGGDPDRFGVSLTAFHRQNQHRLQRWPASLLATSTHDTKRSEDVRARISVLSEMPREWRAALTRWSRLNSRHRSVVDGRAAPDRNEEYLLYQTLLGAWPCEPLNESGWEQFRQRMADFMFKALKEAKVNTSWINPNLAYETAVDRFVRAILQPSDNPFLEDFQCLQQRVAYFGVFNSLSQTALKLFSPGVPDLYQGTELWDFSLVDPDNRRAVDFDRRRRALDELRQAIAAAEPDLAPLAKQLLEAPADGRVKLYLIYQGLTYRRAHPALFAHGSYLPLRATGPQRRHVCAFARAANGEAVVVAVPVLVVGLTRGSSVPPLGEAVWGSSCLRLSGSEGDRYRNLLTGQELSVSASDGGSGLPLAEVFRDFPVALLEKLPR